MTESLMKWPNPQEMDEIIADSDKLRKFTTRLLSAHAIQLADKVKLDRQASSDPDAVKAALQKAYESNRDKFEASDEAAPPKKAAGKRVAPVDDGDENEGKGATAQEPDPDATPAPRKKRAPAAAAEEGTGAGNVTLEAIQALAERMTAGLDEVKEGIDKLNKKLGILRTSIIQGRDMATIAGCLAMGAELPSSPDEIQSLFPEEAPKTKGAKAG